jgi:hypothetical protein
MRLAKRPGYHSIDVVSESDSASLTLAVPGVGKLAMVVVRVQGPRAAPALITTITVVRVSVYTRVEGVFSLLPLLIYVPRITSVCGTSPCDSHLSSRTPFQVII